MVETKVGLLRHGQTDWNIDFRLQGITDIPLNATGLLQAKQATLHLSGDDWDFIVSSPLMRAKQTAEIVAQALKLTEVAIEPLLLERSFGEAEGIKYEEWKTLYPDGIAPGCETLDVLRQRANRLLDALLETYRGTRVLTVSHGALIRKLVRMVSAAELPREGERFGNASLSIIVHDGQQWRIENYDPRSLAERNPD